MKLPFLSVLFTIFLLYCYAPFSPERARFEIERQTGAKLEDSFEFELGTPTMKLIKKVSSQLTGESVTLGGVERIEVAVYSLLSGKKVDFKKIGTRGWEKIVNSGSEDFSFMILTRPDKKIFKDLIIFAQEKDKVFYGRLKGNLKPELPKFLEEIVNKKGIEGLKKRLSVPFKNE